MSELWPVILASVGSWFVAFFAAAVVERHVNNGRHGRAAGFSFFCVLFMLFVLALFMLFVLANR